MDSLKKPENIFTLVLGIVLVGYIVYDYRKHGSQAEKIKQIEDNLAATVQRVGQMTEGINRLAGFTQELVKLKERQEELEEDHQDKFNELIDSLEDLVSQVKKAGISVDVDFPEGEDKKKKKKGKKSKKSKKDKKSKKRKDDSSDDESDDSSDEESKNSETLDRMSRLKEKRKK